MENILFAKGVKEYLKTANVWSQNDEEILQIKNQITYLILKKDKLIEQDSVAQRIFLKLSSQRDQELFEQIKNKLEVWTESVRKERFDLAQEIVFSN